MYASYKQNSYWDILSAPPEGTVLNVVRAEQSDRFVQHLIIHRLNCSLVMSWPEQNCMTKENMCFGSFVKHTACAALQYAHDGVT